MWWTVWSWEYYTYEDGSYGYEDTSCDYGGVLIRGEIMSYLTSMQYDEDYVSADDVIFALRSFEEQHLPAVMLDITSWGGSPAASKEIADYVATMQTPVVASIREAALSGGYYIASQADKIFAAPASDIGSIAVTMSYLDEAELNNKAGYTWNNLSTGEFKDSGSRQKPLTEEERAIFERDLEILHAMFVADVARGRGLSVEEVELWADGSSVLADQALELGLIDGVMHQWEVMQYIQDTYNAGEYICWE